MAYTLEGFKVRKSLDVSGPSYLRGNVDVSEGALNYAPTVSMVVDYATDIANAQSNSIEITGNGSIATLGTAPAGVVRNVSFTGTVNLINSINVRLPGNANITTSPGDDAVFTSQGDGVWKCTSYKKATSLVKSVVGRYGDVTLDYTDVSGAAPINSPVFTGDPTVPTALAGDNSHSVANTEFVKTAISTAVNTLMGTAPGLLDTLDEIAAAIGDDPNFVGTMTTALGNRLRIDTDVQGLTTTQKTNARTNLGLSAIASTGLFSDLLSVPSLVNTFNTRSGAITLSDTDVNTALGYTAANASDVTNKLALKAPLASPALTGAPTAPTPLAASNDTSIATTKFVKDQNYITSSGAPVQSFNTRTGAISLIGTDVTTALGFTPYNATNPANYITSAGAPVQTVAGKTGNVTLAYTDVSGISTVGHTGAYADLTGKPTTDDITEGVTNQYYTAARARSAISVTGTGSATYNATTGVINIPAPVGIQSTMQRSPITATAGQTLFNVTYTVGLLFVYVNGILVPSANYTANTGTSVVFNSGLALNDKVEFVTLTAVDLVSGIVPVSNGGTGSTTLTGYVKGNGTLQMTASATIPGSDISGSIAGNAGTATKLAAARTINGISFDGSANISFGTDAVSEGVTNKYYTDTRARAAISVAGSGTYNATTGVITISGGVTSVASKTGAVTLAVADITDIGSIATQDANSVSLTGGTINGTTVGATTASTGRFTTIASTVATGTAPLTVASTTAVTNLNADYLDGQHGSYYAPLASPAFSGSPTAPTPALYDDSTKLITSEFLADNALSLKAAMGAGVDLNTIITTGIYHQSSNANATLVLNYPVALAGKLVVYKSPASMIYQEYHEYLNGAVWTRAYYSTAWSSWRKHAYTDSTTFTGTTNVAALTSSGAITSTVVTGNAPLVVASSTLVNNLNADLLDGLQSSYSNTASTIAARDGSGDITTRLVRQEFADQTTISGGIVYRVAGGIGTDNYLRVCNSPSAIRTYLGVPATDAAAILASSNTFTGGTQFANSDTQTGYASAAYQARSQAGDVYIALHAEGNTAVAFKHTRGVQGVSVVDSLNADAPLTAYRLTSTIGTGTSPLTVASTTVVTNLNADYLDGQHGSYYAPLASPSLSGSPTAPTPALGDNDTSIATTAFVQSTVGGILSKSVAGGVDVTLTAAEAGNGHLIFTGALTANINVIVPVTPAHFWIVANVTTGAFTLTVKTSAGTGVVVVQAKRSFLCTDGANVVPADTDLLSRILAIDGTTSGIDADLLDGQHGSYYAPLASPALTGTPTAPTAAAGTNTTQVATTAFVTTALSGAGAVASVAGKTGAVLLYGSDINAPRTDATTDVITAKEIRWKNYGNGHTIIDASNGTAPNGAAINNTYAANAWVASYPTLVGWNGTSTYGVRVDTARYAESSSSCGRVTGTGITWGSYGSVSVTGSTNGYTGVVLNDTGGVLMDNGATHGFYRSNGAWLWNCDNSGNFWAAGNVTAYSDERLKTNWRDIAPGFVELWANLKHGVYDRKDTKDTQAGLSAQGVQKILPQTVLKQKSGYLSLNYGAAAAVATVQLAKRVVEQDKIISELNYRIEKLEELLLNRSL